MNLSLEEYRRRHRVASLKRYVLLALVLYLVFFIEPPLVGSRWRLLEIGGKPALTSRMPATVEFRLWLGPWVAGSAGCNRYEGLYFRFGKLLVTQPLSVTEAFCPQPEGLMQQEQELLAMLARVISYDVKQGKLILTTRDGQQLIFTRE